MSPRQLASLICLTLCSITIAAQAQSKDQQHPTPLGPGRNTAAADSNKQPVQYFYFWAGPGAFTVDFFYKSMGIFGTPLRETLNLDFFNADGKNISHNALTSNDKMEHLQTGGTFDDRRKVILAVAPQKALVEVGGHYEIEVNGAVSFDAPTPIHASGGPLPGEVPLVSPGGALVHPGGPLVQPAPPAPSSQPPSASGGPLVHPVGPLVTPAGPLVQPASGPLVRSAGGPLVQPSAGPLVRGGGPLVTPMQVHETQHELRIVLAGDVLFDFDSARLRPEAVAALQQAVGVMQRRSRKVVRVEGYTDSVGTPEHNRLLSEERARSVEAWLIRNAGYTPTMFHTEALGASHPVAPNTHPDGSDDPQGRQRNRRVEIVIAK
jgi:outer membrane protein OmpA-like peptidoglycan-associated protein